MSLSKDAKEMNEAWEQMQKEKGAKPAPNKASKSPASRAIKAKKNKELF